MSEAGNPGVHFPPPLIFLIGLGVGLGLHQWIALPLVSDARLSWLRLLAGAFALASAWLLLSALRLFRRFHTDPRPWREDSALVVAGIYRHTRNPMYLGMALACAATALWCNSGWPLLLMAPVLAIVQRHVIAREEDYLLRRFGEDYADYRRQVPRWM